MGCTISGVRHFAIFFDDISGEGTNPLKQTELLNRLTDDFVKVKVISLHSRYARLIIPNFGQIRLRKEVLPFTVKHCIRK